MADRLHRPLLCSGRPGSGRNGNVRRRLVSNIGEADLESSQLALWPRLVAVVFDDGRRRLARVAKPRLACRSTGVDLVQHSTRAEFFLVDRLLWTATAGLGFRRDHPVVVGYRDYHLDIPQFFDNSRRVDAAVSGLVHVRHGAELYAVETEFVTRRQRKREFDSQ